MITSEWEKKRNNIGGVVVMTEEEFVPFLLLFFFFKASESSHPLTQTHLFSSVSLTLRVRVCVVVLVLLFIWLIFLGSCLVVQWSYITSTINNYRSALSSTRYYKSKMKSFDTSSSWSDYSYVGQALKQIYSFNKVWLHDSQGKY